MNPSRIKVALAFLLCWMATSPCRGQEERRDGPTSAARSSTALDWESANAKRMFVLSNDGSGIAAISLNTTNVEELRAALKLQELVFRMGGARMPIVDKRFARVSWQKIHIVWDHFPMRPRKHPFEISMKETDSSAHNPPKQIIIAGSGQGVERAVSAFTSAWLGTPLEALEDKSHPWKRRKTIAIPERMKTIYGAPPRK